MAQGIQKRTSKTGKISYRVQIRQSDGFPPKSKSFPNLQEAKDWQNQEKARRRQEAYFPGQASTKHTLGDLVDRYIAIVLPTKPKNAKDTTRQLTWWKQRLGSDVSFHENCFEGSARSWHRCKKSPPR